MNIILKFNVLLRAWFLPMILSNLPRTPLVYRKNNHDYDKWYVRRGLLPPTSNTRIWVKWPHLNGCLFSPSSRSSQFGRRTTGLPWTNCIDTDSSWDPSNTRLDWTCALRCIFALIWLIFQQGVRSQDLDAGIWDLRVGIWEVGKLGIWGQVFGLEMVPCVSASYYSTPSIVWNSQINVPLDYTNELQSQMMYFCYLVPWLWLAATNVQGLASHRLSKPEHPADETQIFTYNYC